MQDIHRLIDQARALGEALAAHPAVQEFHAARQAVLTDAAAQDLLKEHDAQLRRLHEFESQGKPIEVADKHKLNEIEMRMAASDALKRLLRSQTEYVDVMNRVNQAMEEPLMARSQGPSEPRA